MCAKRRMRLSEFWVWAVFALAALLQITQKIEFVHIQTNWRKEASIVQLIRIRLPSCGPGFDLQTQHQRIFNLYLNCGEKRTKINEKRPG